MPDHPAGGAADPLAGLSALEGVASAMAAARDGIDALLRDRGLRRTAPALTAESLLRGAWASARLDGSTSDLDELRSGAGDAVATAAVRVSAGALALVPVLAHSPLQALARLHTVAGQGELPDEELGRPVRGAARLTALGQVLTRPTTAPGLLVAAVVHAEVATAAPFASHNGLVARAAERLVLVARGVDPTSLTVPEAGHLGRRDSYEALLEGYAGCGRTGVQAWLRYAAEAYAAGAQASPLR